MHIIRHPAFRWAITIILMVLMGFQLWSRSDQFQVFKIASWQHLTWYLAAVILLMPVNWYLETLKWHSYLSVHAKVRFSRAFKAVTSGIALSLFTPNRIGEYGGRILFMPYAIRWPVVFSTLMGSVSQNLVAFSAGIFSFSLLFKGFLLLKIIGLIVVLLAALLYFNMHFIGKIVCRLKVHSLFKKLSNQLSHLEDYKKSILLQTLLIA
ncbi:MAG TPA: lysylphosphatidylglycerol synthase domain-containing protein, partial [Saprospiraceae bacterium]|nr:lysylphosphatidylglycerol synthase domain-containing protein [Saprospiraceae bacterium]